MTQVETKLECAAPQVGGYDLLRELGPMTFLAENAGGRRVVLKALDGDCLLKRKLHPQIRDRLGRVRELAMLEVANLIAVERDRERAWMVWEYVPGQTLDQWLAESRSLMDLRWIGREVVRAVESLHALGLVHGSLRASNIIVGPGTRLRLTHVSPLLYDDPENDRQAVVRLIEQIFGSAEGGPAFPREDVEWMTLRELAAWLATAGRQAVPQAEADPAGGEDRRLRRGALTGAAIAAVLGGAVAYGAWRMAHASQPQPSQQIRAAQPERSAAYGDRVASNRTKEGRRP